MLPIRLTALLTTAILTPACTHSSQAPTSAVAPIASSSTAQAAPCAGRLTHDRFTDKQGNVFVIGKPGSDYVSLPGAQKESPSCACAYDIAFPPSGIRMSVSEEGLVCSITTGSRDVCTQEGLRVGKHVGDFEAALQTKATLVPATGETAVGVYTLDDDNDGKRNTPNPQGTVQRISIGGCPE